MVPFFVAAMQAPGRQLAFRKMAFVHVLACCFFVFWSMRIGSYGAPELVGYAAFVLGLIEGAALIGWRLAQLPKSQALEFLLVSPVRPRRLFLSEAFVGCARFLLVQFTGLPVLLYGVFFANFEASDLIPLFVMPITWGLLTGLMLTTWIYESIWIRRIGELIGLFGVLVYLVVGLLAGEHLRSWLEALPTWLGSLFFQFVMTTHEGNPFGVIRYWLSNDRVAFVAWEKFSTLQLIAIAIIIFSLFRAACRLQPHFHDRHYSPLLDNRPDELTKIGDRPLSWWAVRRCMEYSGRVNLWLAVGVAFLYSAFILAGDRWPAQLGKMVFMLFENWGGPASMATMLCVLACVPAVFQYGLWDATTQDRCKTLELLLLSELEGKDYAHAAFSAAWARGKGYLLGSFALWLALGFSGRADWFCVLGAIFGGCLLWMLSFAIGFRSFAKGAQTSGIASLFTIGLPLSLVILNRLGLEQFSGILPHGWCYAPLKTGVNLYWAIGIFAGISLTAYLLHSGFKNCVTDLQSWYDKNHGQTSVE